MTSTAYSTDIVSVIVSEESPRTGFPFNFSRSDYLAELRHRPTADIMAEVEEAQWAALDHAEHPDGTRALLEYQIEAQVAELERRHQLLLAHPDDPLRPTWPKSDETFRARIEAVKHSWPIVRFCRELLVMDLTPTGPGKWKSRCPLPGHDDRTPSFSIDETKNVAFCHGCQRGGDVLKLTQFMLNLERFIDALRRLEREGGMS